MMTVTDVLDVLRSLAGATVWVDGGWGIDALLGTVTREHSDLDLVVLDTELPTTRDTLAEAGFRTVLRDWLPAALALADDHGREIDLHPVSPTADGGGDQSLPDGAVFHYPPPTTGVIGGRPVRCVDAATQLAAHLGYEPTAKDRQDVRRVAERFGLPLPPAYAD